MFVAQSFHRVLAEYSKDTCGMDRDGVDLEDCEGQGGEKCIAYKGKSFK